MTQIKYEDLHEEVLKAVKELEIPEENLFTGSGTDVYIGCRSYGEALALKINKPWHAMSSIFKSQRGSSMGHFQYAIDIAFANIGKMARDMNALNNKYVQNELRES